MRGGFAVRSFLAAEVGQSLSADPAAGGWMESGASQWLQATSGVFPWTFPEGGGRDGCMACGADGGYGLGSCWGGQAGLAAGRGDLCA